LRWGVRGGSPENRGVKTLPAKKQQRHNRLRNLSFVDITWRSLWAKTEQPVVRLKKWVSGGAKTRPVFLWPLSEKFFPGVNPLDKENRSERVVFWGGVGEEGKGKGNVVFKTNRRMRTKKKFTRASLGGTKR